MSSAIWSAVSPRDMFVEWIDEEREFAYAAHASEIYVLCAVYRELAICDPISAERDVHGINETKVGYSADAIFVNDE